MNAKTNGDPAAEPLKIGDPLKLSALKALGQLPSPEGVALAIMQLLRKEKVNANEIARLVKADPALTGRIIKAANLSTAFIPGRRPVAGVPDSIVILGVAAVRQFALGFSLISKYREGVCQQFDYDGFWSRSLLAAIAMQALTTHTHAAQPEETFVTGLLSRIGSLALATLFPQHYGRLLVQAAGFTHIELARLEQKELATDHNELTACLLADWGIPQTLVESAYYHEHPDSCSYPTGSRAYLLVRSLNLAVRLSEVLTAPGERRPWALAELFASGARLGLDAEAMIALADQLVREWQEWGRVLKVTTQNVASFADLSQIFRDLPAADPGDGLVEARGSGALRVMVVDGHWPALLQLQETLREAGHEVCIATDGEDALKVALERRPQVVITDWIMPNMDGVSLCRALRETKVGNSMYLVLLAEDEEESTLETAFEAGVDDCKVKPLNYRALVSRMRTFERVIKLREEIELDREEIRRFAGDLAIANKRLQESALVDALTQIPNRRYAVDRMHTEWVAAQRSGDPLSCMMIDIDCFKRINDNYGHACGDGILRAVAQVLKINARAGDVVARLGGEEFLVICPGTRLVEAGRSAERLRSAVQTSSLDDRVPDGEQITVSIGVAMIEDGMCGSEDVIELADQALYVAKHTGRNRACVAHSRNLIFPVRAVQPFVSEPGIALNAANFAH